MAERLEDEVYSYASLAEWLQKSASQDLVICEAKGIAIEILVAALPLPWGSKRKGPGEGDLGCALTRA
ncbi:hypothetical protein [Mesorhizobium shangrilense]|uniref:Uncharacterized protein n=1 Tax=Mesorhizobium shangrilense TaxID=460060 RepID=A0ABV2DAL5_9HYPH